MSWQNASWFDGLVAAGAEILADKLTLKSNWGSLHKNLFATIAPCDKDGNLIAGASAVSAPLIDSADMQQQFNWQSPFENVPAESKNPTLAARLQSGQLEMVTQLIASKLDDGKETGGGVASEALKSLADIMGAAEGRSGITKLNSRQVFVGHEPLKIDITLVFRAYQDPVSEVVQPINALWRMGYPVELAEDMVTAAVQAGSEASNDTSNVSFKDAVKTLFPSVAPNYVAFTYKGETRKPMVIESISRPLINPHSAFGDIYATVQITLGTFRSLDQKDLQNTGSSALTKLVDSTADAVSNLFN